MIRIRKSATRGKANHGWLDSMHTFSFANYHDPRYMSFGPLRVINEDKVIGGQGFGTHSHSNMEIVSYVLDGALEHKDSMGTGSVLRYGDVQRMSAGSGVSHSEFNHSADERVHFLQIWLFPDQQGIAPSYQEANFSPASKRGQLRLIVSPDGADGSLSIHQDARIFATILDGDNRLQHTLAPGRGAYVQVARGQLQVNGVTLDAGDALQLADEAQLTLENGHDAEVLVFDLPL
ncbi:pirin family protein [Stenotrophomonas tumulicola]|uniref:Pirin family protein n=1 Tax=Stenotrophomonas tumulicola TaxID=1685415 RepID=A0A7W3FJA9_9GAMM|nr:pirin family protein [Stenotrophomonas tumulicola]MBA8680576.1 pirin family protein [Stenotrophomonas tumulicola]